MESTKRLRKWVNEHFDSACWSATNAALNNGIDAVEEEFRRQRDTLWNEGYDMGFASADKLIADYKDELAEHGWVKLPVDGEAPSKQLADWIERRGLVTGPLDASGELWHSGDMSDSNWGVIEYITFQDGMWFVSGHDTSAPWVPADSIRHHHEPTVEDVLREFGDWYAYTKGGCDEDGIIAEYAAKLRLAGDE